MTPNTNTNISRAAAPSGVGFDATVLHNQEEGQGLVAAASLGGASPSAAPASALLPHGVSAQALSVVRDLVGERSKALVASSDSDILHDASFPAKSIKQFVSERLKIDESVVEQRLYAALPIERQTVDNLVKIQAAMAKPVNASGALMLFVNTGTDGVHLLCTNSQRRKQMFQTNGACEKGESIHNCAIREFFEEAGNPPQDGLLASIVNNPANRVSSVAVNQIGKDLTSIATRMVTPNKQLYFNMSSSYLNQEPVSLSELRQELKGLNDRLSKFSPFYKDVVELVFCKPSLDFASAEVQERSRKVIGNFQKQVDQPESAGFLTEGVATALEGYRQNTSDPEAIRNALLAIADVTENNEVSLMSRSDLEKVKRSGQKLDGFFDAGFPILHDLLNNGPVAELFRSPVA